MQRYEGLEVDIMAAENDAKALYKAGEKRLGTDEDVFIRILSGRSRAHLAAVDTAYNRLYGHSLEKVLYYPSCVSPSYHLVQSTCNTQLVVFQQAIKKETSGLFEYALLTIARCAENPAKYFAKVLLMLV